MSTFPQSFQVQGVQPLGTNNVPQNPNDLTSYKSTGFLRRHSVSDTYYIQRQLAQQQLQQQHAPQSAQAHYINHQQPAYAYNVPHYTTSRKGGSFSTGAVPMSGGLGQGTIGAPVASFGVQSEGYSSGINSNNVSGGAPGPTGLRSSVGYRSSNNFTSNVRSTSPHTKDPDYTNKLVNEYFETDPHERVKVTVQLLEDQFFDEVNGFVSGGIEMIQLPKMPLDNPQKGHQLALVGFKAGRIDVFALPSELNRTVKVGDLVIVEADRGKDLGKVCKMNISIDEARLMKLLQFQEQQLALNEDIPSPNVRHLLQGGNNGGSTNDSGSTHALGHHAQLPPVLHVPKSIIGLATQNEILQILNKKQDEEKACRLCLAKISSTIANANASASLNANGLSGTATTHNGSNCKTITLDLMQMKLIDAEYQFDRKKLIFYYLTSKRIDFRDLVRELFRIYKTRIWMCAVQGIPYIPHHHYKSNSFSHTSGGVTIGHGNSNNVSSNINGGGHTNGYNKATRSSSGSINDRSARSSYDDSSSNHISPISTSDDTFTGVPSSTKSGLGGPDIPFEILSVPRNFNETGASNVNNCSPDRSMPGARNELDEDINFVEGESFVLKSLVDQMNN
ncbi:uncharacterized protein KQ657_003630 [Scheffersomyces spartinae]|uniref:PSP1 C-terminal domain-containing protein n=1 Tax=Scheffersomyces spartinae TaxID=45513 RepID=A0A9P7VBV6_9ASCO|nr:uncharacterized protein KQ657_003630 [Scheffersomyces spartinae]KAG7195109.1 hypothetical protein KQ657_003630 [Scheffersomyces spartinae]